FATDAALSDAYHQLNGGKWNGMMLQTKFGYTSWNDPKTDVMPEVKRVGGQPRAIRFLAPSAPTARASYAAAEATDFARASN
ncbi:hypothetical protein NL487_28660, partial [Klebsiella pneumoniae]|nr:hypothetical protein [Klebsiella pneumoniae]